MEKGKELLMELLLIIVIYMKVNNIDIFNKLYFELILFIQLECWENEPNDRPNIQNVVSILKMITSEQNDTILVDKEEQLEICQATSKSNQISMETNDLNDILVSDSRLIIEDTETLNSASSIDTLESIFDKTNNIVADKLIKVVIQKHDQGIIFDQIQQLIDQLMLKFNQNIDKFVKWLSKNQV